MKNGRGRAIPQEMFGKIHDGIIWTVGWIKDIATSLLELLFDRVKVLVVKTVKLPILIISSPLKGLIIQTENKEWKE